MMGQQHPSSNTSNSAATSNINSTAQQQKQQHHSTGCSGGIHPPKQPELSNMRTLPAPHLPLPL